MHRVRKAEATVSRQMPKISITAWEKNIKTSQLKSWKKSLYIGILNPSNIGFCKGWRNWIEMIPPFWWLLASLTPQPWFFIQVSGENKWSSKHWAHFWWWLKQLLRWFTPKTRYSDSLLFVTWRDDHQPGTVVQLGTWLQPDHGCTFYLFTFCQEVLEFVRDGRLHVDLWWFCWMHGWRILFKKLHMITGKKKREQPASQSRNFPKPLDLWP